MEVHNAHMITAIQSSYARAYKNCANGTINYTQFEFWINGLKYLEHKERQYEIKEDLPPMLCPY